MYIPVNHARVTSAGPPSTYGPHISIICVAVQMSPVTFFLALGFRQKEIKTGNTNES